MALDLLSSSSCMNLVFMSLFSSVCCACAAIRTGTLSVGDLIRNFQAHASDYFVTYLRFLISAYMQLNPGDFAPFLPMGTTVEEFCRAEVEPTGKECEEVHIMALTQCLQVGIRIEYLDASPHDLVTHCYNEEGDMGVVCSLLYKPGHYDLLCDEPLPSQQQQEEQVGDAEAQSQRAPS